MYIVIDGTDGSGKTSLMKKIDSYLSSCNTNYLMTKEPGSPYNEMCVKMREIVVSNEHLDEKSELLLMLADRAQHLSNVVKPALYRKKVVVSDRSLFSTIAYQGFGRYNGNQEMLDFIGNLNLFVMEDVRPDIAIFLTSSFETAKQRILKRNHNSDRFENSGEAFHNKVKTGFEYIEKQYSENKDMFQTKIHLIQTDMLTEQEVFSKVEKILIEDAELMTRNV